MKIIVTKPTEDELIQKNVKSWSIWECEPSEFPWHYDDSETCYILKGKVKVSTEFEEIEFGVGDLVTFPKGLSCTWKIEEGVRKHYKFG